MTWAEGASPLQEAVSRPRLGSDESRLRAPVAALALALATILGILLSLPASGQAGEYEEDEVKAALLLNFALYTEWPEESAVSEVDICLAGVDDRRIFDRVLRGAWVEELPVELRPVRSRADLYGCRIVFVRDARELPIEGLFETCRDQSILAVGEDPDFLETGGHVALRLDDGKVRFDVNLLALEAADLRLSSRVVRLARALYPAEAIREGWR